jgi:hypothetical protein
MDAQPSLDAGLLVSRDDELVLAQRLALPAPLVQIQQAPGLGLEVRIARKDPAAVLPGANRVFMQPTPDGAVADARHRPEHCACRATSATLRRDNGSPKVAGISHASALISTVSSGGKDPRASRACSLFEARQSILEETLAPLADHLAPRVQARGDLVVVHAVGC